MRYLSGFILAVGCWAAALSATASSPPHSLYRVTVLSSEGASGNSINDLGVVGGSITPVPGISHAAVWAFGHQIDLGTIGKGAGLSSLVQWPVKNVLGLVSGISLTDALDPNHEIWSCGFFINNPGFNVCRAFLWDPVTRQMRSLPTLGGTSGFGTGTNDLGETVGWAETPLHDPSCLLPQVLQFLPVVWGPGRDEIHALPLIAGDSSGAATAINDRGQIVGISGSCGNAVGGPTARNAVLWDNGVTRVLVNPNGAPYWNTPMMISGRGDVVGFAGVPGDAVGNFTPPFMWTPEGGWQFLPLLAGDIAGIATSINNTRQVVGYSNDATTPIPNFHPWIWQNGVLTNLNAQIVPGSPLTGPMTLAFDINDRGEITGTTTTGQAIVLTPVEQDDER